MTDRIESQDHTPRWANDSSESGRPEGQRANIKTKQILFTLQNMLYLSYGRHRNCYRGTIYFCVFLKFGEMETLLYTPAGMCAMI